MRSVAVAVLLGCCAASAAAAPPLSPEAIRQLATADDLRGGLDEAALYPLLENAAASTPGDEAGAAVPDYAALRDEPASHRGALCLIEGEFVVGGDPEERLSRPGPWDGHLQRWLVRPDQRRDALLLVLLTDPPPLPRPGQQIRLPARFYKAWRDEPAGASAASRELLTFVGRGAAVLRPATGPEPSVRPVAALLLAVMAGGVLLFLTRMLVRWRELARGRRSPAPGRLAAAPTGDDNAEPTGPPLPDDPGEALRELERRHAADEPPSPET